MSTNAKLPQNTNDSADVRDLKMDELDGVSGGSMITLTTQPNWSVAREGIGSAD